MPLAPFLDPRFHLIATVMNDPDERPEMRETARQRAEILARQCGFSLDEAMTHLRPPAPVEEIPAGDEPDAETEAVSMTTNDDDTGDEHLPSDARDGQIASALKANPDRADRDIARELSASPTTVGKVRKALGLGAMTRTVTRGRTAYPMAVGDRS